MGQALDSFPKRATKTSRYESLDLWRGAACLLVVVFHCTPYTPYYQATLHGLPYEPAPGLIGYVGYLLQRLCSEMWAGVPMFFVISGYCIFATMDSQRRRGATMATFFRRRVRRIYPPYWLALVITGFLVGACVLAGGEALFADETPPFYPWKLSPAQIFGNTFLIETWRSLAFGGEPGIFLGIMWTLCYEEQFYALAALVLLAAPKRIFQAAIAITLFTFVARFVADQAGRDIRGFFFDGYWMQFAAGIFVYYVVNYLKGRDRWIWTAAFTTAAVATFFVRDLFPSDIDRSTVLASLFAAGLMILYPWDSSVAHARWLRPISYSGQICYSMYMIHWPICKVITRGAFLAGFNGVWETLLVTLPVCLALSVGAAALFFHWVERHFLNAPSEAPPAREPVGRLATAS
jgi:peptidoglycan/LPS O-acetylase OafA/YrhL